MENIIELTIFPKILKKNLDDWLGLTQDMTKNAATTTLKSTGVLILAIPPLWKCPKPFFFHNIKSNLGLVWIGICLLYRSVVEADPTLKRRSALPKAVITLPQL